jgi:hypothetical protein
MAQRLAMRHGSEPNPLDATSLLSAIPWQQGPWALDLIILTNLMTRPNDQRHGAG